MRVAFVYYDYSSFVEQDYEILSRHFDVERVQYSKPGDIFEMASSISRSDIVFSWFAAGHSFLSVMLSRIFGKRSVVVAGGYDVAFLPDIGYGQYTQGWIKRKYTDLALENADAVLAVSQFTREEVLKRTKPRRLEVVYNGVDTEKFHPKGEKDDLVLTVASGSTNVIKLKGLDTFVEAAYLLPNVKFLIIGVRGDVLNILRSKSPENVKILGRVSRDELVECYQRAKVYCQLSYVESFGMALAEAMACGCVPVVTDRGALPEVVGDTGFYVPYGDEKATAEAIRMAMVSEKSPRDRIERSFRIDQRERRLVTLLKELPEKGR
ncbi:glycosyltransferase family 4 protein [Methanothrix thermoacetophila]|uniref:Glycosyl transferase, group 1 n=1 Tax=Methanothrix thermoacetophila (strain DSM 6194 / JCM 14653 / NBRC 101360 / PT) TaxID=349307 RepID=A0B9R8_METTP|nr:glycosyltransferase family 4 protein [Methanothrix thermoacetophila]ABK15442.1 glycosyl transferase, group 1 [Methanothrix thermoacetophila PT]